MEKRLIDVIGVPAMLEQTAEEAAELVFACLKLARFMRDENKVHGYTEIELDTNLAEEMADLRICMDELMGTVIAHESVDSFISSKYDRMYKRLEGLNE